MGDILGELNNLGIDTAIALPRFSNSMDMYLKYMFRFPEEQAIVSYREEYEAGNLDKAFEHIHNFKGITGSLGIKQLYELATELTELLRKNSTEGADSLNARLYDEYQRISLGIAVCRDDNL